MAFNEVLRLVLDVDAAKGKRELDDFSKKASTNLTRVGSTMTKVGGTLSRQVSLPLVALGGVATKMAADFDASFTQMQTLAGVTAGEVDGMKESILDLARETGKAPNELAEALYFLRSSGLDAAQSMDALEMSAKASAAGLGDTATIADAASSVMLAYASTNLTAAQALDVLIATARAGKVEPAELAGQMGRLVPLSAELGISFGDVGAAIAVLSQRGNDASMATTQLSGIFAKLLSPSRQATEALDEVGLSVDDIRGMIAEKGLLGALEELDAALGRQGLIKFMEDVQAKQGVLSILGGNLEDTRDIFDEVNDSVGALDSAFGTWAESMGAKNARAFADLQVAMIEFGDAIAPIVSNVLGFVGDLVSVFSDLPEPVQNVVVGVLAFAAALGPLMSISGNVVSFIGNMTKLTGSLGSAIGSTTLAAGAFAAVLAVAGTVLFEHQRRQAEAKERVDELADALALGGDAAKVAADKINLDKIAAGELGNKLREAGADLTVFTDAVFAGGEMTKEMERELRRLVDTEALTGAEAALLAEAVSQMGDEQAKAGEQAKTAAFSQEQLAGEAEKVGLVFDEQGKLVDEATTALQEYADQVKAMLDPMFGMLDALTANRDAQQVVAEAQAVLNDAIAEHGRNSAEAAEAQRDLDGAMIDAGKSAYDVTLATSELNAAIAENPALVDDAKAMLSQWVRQGLITQQQAQFIGAAFDLTAQKAINLGETDPSINIAVTGVAEAFFNIKAIQDRINAMRGRDVHIRVVGTSVGVAIPGGGLRAHGGPVRKGEGYFVGEEGVEWFEPDQNGTIIPNHMLGSMAPQGALVGGGGAAMGGGVARVVIDITGGDDKLMGWLKNRIRVEGRGDVQVALGQRR